MSDAFHSASERIFDSFARVLECDQECVAAASINGSFIIAANGLKSNTAKGTIAGTGSRTSVIHIHEIIRYFSALINGIAILPDAHNAVFSQHVFIPQRWNKHLKTAASQVTTAIHDGATIYALQGNKDVPRRLLLDRHGHNLAITGGVYNEAIDLHEGFTKIVQGISGVGDVERFTPEQLQGIRTCIRLAPADYILHDEDDSGVHAEMQILGYILRQVEAGRIPRGANIYIGISKRCCHDCHLMLDTANHLLQDSGISLAHRGDHDIRFDGWVQSEVIEGTELGKQIIHLYEEIKKGEKSQKGVSMGLDASDSDTELSIEERVDLLRKELQSALEVLQKCPIQDEAIQQNIKIIHSGLALCDSLAFQPLFGLNRKTPDPQIQQILIPLRQICHQNVLVARFLQSNFFSHPLKEQIIARLQTASVLRPLAQPDFIPTSARGMEVDGAMASRTPVVTGYNQATAEAASLSERVASSAVPVPRMADSRPPGSAGSNDMAM